VLTHEVFDAKTCHCQLYDCTLVLASDATICQQFPEVAVFIRQNISEK
jgi:hypothetical protein